MSEGADLVTQETCGDSRATTTTTLADEGERDATTAATRPPSSSPPPPSTTTTYTGRRPRCGTGCPPPSPYMWIDGRRLRSALVWVRKPSEGTVSPRRVSFPTSDKHLVTGYLEPANPWRHAENASRDDLVFAYKESCARHRTEHLQNVLVQIENLDISQDRCEELNLKGENLDQHHCEPLEEILKRVQFNKINLEGTSLDDESSIILFDMLEYYESAKYLNISSNPNIGPRGWQACSHMIKKTQCLEQLEARDIMLNEQYMNILSRALRLVCHLHVLKLENCGLSGRAIVILVTALKMNSGIRELYLADNGLDLYDAIQLGSLLRMNNHLQLLDISNNNVQDDGVRDILEGLINQVNEDKTGKGLSILILWNNRLTKKASPYISRIIALSKTLETLNIGKNMLTDETLSTVNESLKKNRVLLQLGMQSTELTCDGIITLAEIVEANQVLQRIDLRDNSIQMRGMHALVNVMKKNKSITQIDLDDKPRIRIDSPLHQYMDLVAEIRSYCNQNEHRHLLEESNEDAESPQHPSRLLNASSRKISLTCQTLPSPSRTAASLAAAAVDDEPAARNMLEPKRTSGGRLRSPAPSPIPSPVASPIPSPSRNRFVVCRVPEASLRSTDSSASSSPVTPPSLSSSPTCFFPGTSSHGTSRFRVSVVESVSTSHSSPRSVVTSPSGNVTIGFNFKVSVGSDDSNSVTKADAKTQDVDDNVAASVETLNNVVPVARETSFYDNVAKNEDRCNEGMKGEKVDECEAETQFEKSIDVATIREVSCDNTVNESNIAMDLKSATTASGDIETIGDRRTVYTSTKELHVPAYSCEGNASAKISIIEDTALNSTRESFLDDTATEPSADPTSETFSGSVLESSTNTTLETSSTCMTHSQERTSTSVQKHKSSLEKLLSLFQYPGNFFSDSNVAVDTRASLQENVSGMMALGDKLQQYLKEGRAKVSTDSSSWFSQHGSPSRNKSMRLNVSQLQSLTDIFASFKLEPHVSLVEHGTKFFGQTKNQDATNSEKDIQKPPDIDIARDDKKDSLCQEKDQIAKSEKQNLFSYEFTETSGNGGKNSGEQKTHQVVTNDENNLFDQEKNYIVDNDKKEYVNSKSNQRIVSNEEDLIYQDKDQVTRNDESNLFDQEQKHITKDDESDLAAKEKNQVSKNGKTDLFNLDKCQVARNNEQMLVDQVTRNEKNLISQEKSETTNNENNLFDQVESPISRNDKKSLKDTKEEVAMKTDENFEVQEKNQIIEVTGDLQNQGEDEIINQDEHDLRDQREAVVRNSEDLKDWDENKTASNDEKDSINVRDVNVGEDTCSVCELQWTESNSNREKRSLLESVQLKDDFADKDLVLGGEPCVAMTNVAMSPSSSYKFITCVAVKLTNIPEYSVLELSQVDTGVECKNAKRFSSDDENRQEPSDDAQDLERVKHNNIERSKRDDSQANIEHDEAEVLEYVNDEKCLERDDAVEKANARKTCDITTTDSINQTSDNSFPICNIARDRKVVDSINTVSTLAMSSDIDATAFASESDGILSTSLINVGAEDADATDRLNDEVTSGVRRAVDEDRERDFTQRKKEQEEGYETIELLDDACRDSAHHISTSVNTRVEPQISKATSSTSGTRDVPTESLRERQSSAPNNVDVHRIILKDAAVTDDHSEDAVDDADRCIDPAVFIMPYETSMDKSDADELIFCITDISTDGTSVEDELSPGAASRNSLNDITKVMDSYFELPTTTPMMPTTTTTLLIDNPEGVHRNSQDSGIDETALTIDDAATVDAHPLPPARGSLQESVDSGIESECSSICVRIESAAERTLEAAAATKRSARRDGTQQWGVAREQRRDNGDAGDDDDEDDDDNDDGGDDGDDFFDGEFASDFLAKETLLIDNDSVSDIARSYLNSIKSAVVSTTQPVAELPSGAPLGVVVANEDIARPTAAVIAHPPAAVHGTSPK